MVILLRFVWEPRPRNLYDVCNDPIRKTTLRIVLLTRLTVFFDTGVRTNEVRFPPPLPHPPSSPFSNRATPLFRQPFSSKDDSKTQKKTFVSSAAQTVGSSIPAIRSPPWRYPFHCVHLCLCVSLSPREEGAVRWKRSWLAVCLSVFGGVV